MGLGPRQRIWAVVVVTVGSLNDQPVQNEEVANRDHVEQPPPTAPVRVMESSNTYHDIWEQEGEEVDDSYWRENLGKDPPQRHADKEKWPVLLAARPPFEDHVLLQRT